MHYLFHPIFHLIFPYLSLSFFSFFFLSFLHSTYVHPTYSLVLTNYHTWTISKDNTTTGNTSNLHNYEKFIQTKF